MEFCNKCCQPIQATHGLAACICNKTIPGVRNLYPKKIKQNVGWICPLCGIGLSPNIANCPCKTIKI
ncbi:MAG TPA: hypothetical protein ENI08_02255 [Candidatus Dependentiae bacterium]|nr:hypothetical protein [Candidatus Dependentiae bacterium]